MNAGSRIRLAFDRVRGARRQAAAARAERRDRREFAEFYRRLPRRLAIILGHGQAAPEPANAREEAAATARASY